MSDDLIDARQAAVILGISVHTLRMWRKKGRGPAFVKFGGARQAHTRYRRADLGAFVRAGLKLATATERDGAEAADDVTIVRPCLRSEHSIDVALADMRAHREQLWLNDETCVPVFFRVTTEGALERWLPDLARWYRWNPEDAPRTAWIRCSFLTMAADAGQSESVTIHKGVTPGPSRLWSEP